MAELYRFILVESGCRKVRLGLLSILVAGFLVVPLELQRRIVNDAIGVRQLALPGRLCRGYLGLVALQSGLKFCMRLQRGPIAEEVIRRLRTRAFCLMVSAEEGDDPTGDRRGTRTSSEEGGKATSFIALAVAARALLEIPIRSRRYAWGDEREVDH